MNEDAIRSFERLFEFNLNYIDPYLQYIELTKNVKGKEYLNEYFTKLSEEYSNNQLTTEQ